MGTLKVDNIQTESGSAIITNGAIPAAQLRSSGVGKILLNTTTISTSTANVAFNSSIIDTANYKNFEIIANGMSPATDAQAFQMIVSYDNGSTFFSDGYHGGVYSRFDNTTTGGQSPQQTGTSIGVPSFTIGNADYKEKTDFHYYFYNCDESTVRVVGTMIQRNANTYHYLTTTGAVWNDNQIMNYIDFRFASGNIAAGTFKVYGMV